MDNFKRYSSREEYIIEKWIENTPWLKERLIKKEANNTAFHDYKLTLQDNNREIELIIEIKEEEYYWFSKTQNIGLDYLSAFTYKNGYKRENLWVRPSELKYFLNNIDVGKYGKLKTCDADIQLFFCEDNNKNIVLLNAYNNNLLKSNEFLNYLYKTHSLRVNNKEHYKINDNWESAAFFVKYYDTNLNKCKINSFEDLKNE